jgi:hypothetical protein
VTGNDSFCAVTHDCAAGLVLCSKNNSIKSGRLYSKSFTQQAQLILDMIPDKRMLVILVYNTKQDKLNEANLQGGRRNH